METFIAPIKSIEGIGSFEGTKSIESQKNGGFGDILSQAVSELEAASETNQANDYQLALGDVDNLAQLQIDSLKTQTLLQTTVQLTTRAVNAYKEIMQMQV
ncbi:flagellar hook-basal body complex protein FliE [Scatolibacter rhodanostii]|uniref:flagellar hook-basal body complex protein FliE n=1 Tax=Scatolibacter rhodanostii TaxID=2014781 RepID=UPI000C08005C|nr:flagellar hook-basal body complex protein FliE [Scatolibacter rhodanostii]